jgi:RNA polymerase sigma-70 factor (ECF subfamily)
MRSEPPAAAATAAGEITIDLARLRQGDRSALDRVLERLYGELRTIARQRLRHEYQARPFVTTELVHETYLRLLRDRTLDVSDRLEFFAVASNAMRRILVEAARARDRRKRGGEHGAARHVDIADVEELLTDDQAREMIDLDRALDKLRTVDPRAATVVEHRFFSGLSLEESASLLGVSTKTVQRDWLTARAWIRRELA